MPSTPADAKATDRQVKALAGLIKKLSGQGFFGTVVIRFEAGHVVKTDHSTSLRITDIEELLTKEETS